MRRYVGVYFRSRKPAGLLPRATRPGPRLRTAWTSVPFTPFGGCGLPEGKPRAGEDPCVVKTPVGKTPVGKTPVAGAGREAVTAESAERAVSAQNSRTSWSEVQGE